MEVKVISSEMIKPSSPTPPHLRSFKLSFVDQLLALFYNTTIFHYPPNHSNHDIAQVVNNLKASLSETLTRFYPLAGRIRNAFSMDCNDEGVLFVEARVNCNMVGFLKKPDLDAMYNFVPSLDVDLEHKSTLVQIGVQVNIFASGGISIGLCTLHKLIDAVTLGAFMKCWASICGGRSEKSMYPDLFLASSLFPPQEFPSNVTFFRDAWLLKEGKSVQRRFVFDKRSITALKAEAASEVVPNPSGVVAVACFIWKCMVAASQRVDHTKQCFTLASALNMRRRTNPPLSEYSIGNIFYWVMVNINPTRANELGLQGATSLVNKALAKFDDGYVRGLQGDEGSLLTCKYVEEIHDFHSKVRPDTIVFSSTNQIGFTDTDFGWGKAVWSSHIRGSAHGEKFLSTISLAETGHSHGIDAWLVLGENEMTVLENDPEFLNFASPNPSIPVPTSHI